LKQLRRRWPNAHHFIIAHSHGGNIALHALHDTDLKRSIAGIACLATPFLNVRRRDLGPLGQFYIIVSGAVLFGISIPFLLDLLPLSTPGWLEWIFSMSLAPAAFLLVFLMVRWQKWGDGLPQRFAFPEIEPSRLLIIRTIGDEAQAALAGAQFVGWLSKRFWLPVSRLGARFYTLRGLRGILLFYPLFLVVLLAGALLVPVLALISIPLFAIGPELALAGPFVDVAVEATPQGSWLVHQLPALESKQLSDLPPNYDPRAVALRALEKQQLSHSQSYEDPRAVALIAAWMRSAGVSGAIA
jgi:hypothetical protein